MKIILEHRRDHDIQVFENENDFINEVNKTQQAIEDDNKEIDLQIERAENLQDAIKIYAEYDYNILISAD